jgi:hypothetical protein
VCGPFHYHSSCEIGKAVSNHELNPDWQEKAAIAVNTGVQGVLLGIPVFGPSLAHFIFGPMAELRMQRFEKTLSEVAAAVKDRASQTAMANERFVELLESVAAPLSRSIDEGKRLRFRDLLTNAAQLRPDDAQWEAAALAARLLSEIDAPGLAILAAISQAGSEQSVSLVSRPRCQVVCGRFDWERPGEPQHALAFEWPIADYWARVLRERRMIRYASHDSRGGFGDVQLAELGAFLIRWTMRN